MAYSDDDLRFEFRDPDSSDEDDRDTVTEDYTNNAAFSSEEDDEFQVCVDSLDSSARAHNRKSGEMSGIFEGTSKSIVTFPYVQASDLQRVLHAGMSLLGQSSRERAEGSSSGPEPTTSKAANRDAFLHLGNDIDQVLKRLVELKEAVIAEECAVVEDVPPETRKASCSYSYSDGGNELIPVRKRTMATSNKRDSPELEYDPRQGTPSALHVHYSEAGHSTSHETLKEHLALIGPALNNLRTLAEDLASSLRTSELETGMIDSVKVGKPRLKIVFGGREETNALPSLRPGTRDGKPEASHRRRSGNEDEGETSSATVAGQSDGRSKVRGVRILSRRQRLDARLCKSTMYDGSWVCSTCGVQQNIQANEDVCIVCSDENRAFSESPSSLDRVSVPWMTQTEVENMSVENSFHILEPDLCYQIYTLPRCFQSHRAIFLKLPDGNILWDCLTYIDRETVVEIAKMGGLKAIAISNPDRMGSCARMSYIFNRCPIYIHSSDRAYLPLGKNSRESWDNQMKYLGDGVTLIHLGVHFPGSSILHLDHKGGIVLSSNTLKVGADRNSVSVMLDCTNYIPAHARDIKRILQIMQNLNFDQVWGDQPGEEIGEHGKPRVISSLLRYIRWTLHDEDAVEFHTRPLTKRELIARGKRKVHEI